MKRTLTFLTALGLAASAWAFPTNILTDSVNIDNLRSDWREWRFENNAEEDAMFSLDMRNNAGPLTVSDYAWTFRVSRRVAGGSNLTYVAIDNTGITKSTSNLIFAIAWSNIPPVNAYNTELRMTHATAPVTPDKERGKSISRFTLETERSASRHTSPPQTSMPSQATRSKGRWTRTATT